MYSNNGGDEGLFGNMQNAQRATAGGINSPNPKTLRTGGLDPATLGGGLGWGDQQANNFTPMGSPHPYQGHTNQGMLPTPTPISPMSNGWNQAGLATTNPQSIFNEGGGPVGGGPMPFPPGPQGGHSGYGDGGVGGGGPLGFPPNQQGPMGFEPRPRYPYESTGPVAMDPSKFNPALGMRQKGPFHDPRTTMAPPQGGNDLFAPMPQQANQQMNPWLRQYLLQRNGGF